MEPYVVRQGEYLKLIAFRRGFDAAAVWGHEANRALRERRADPAILAPGDVLYVPKVARRALVLRTGTSNTFQASPPAVRVKLVLKENGVVLSGVAFVVEGVPEPIRGTSNGAGEVDFEVPVSVGEVRLTLPDRGRSFPVRVGHLDPITEPAGVRTRLAHLGFQTPPSPRLPGLDGWARVSVALAEFQRSRDLPPTGQLDDATRDALLAQHGS